MKSVKVEDGRIIKDDSGVVARVVYSAPEAMIVHIDIRPEGFVKPHVTAIDMEYFVIEGRGQFILGEESMEAGPGVCIPNPRGVPHGIRNIGTGPLRVLAVKNPRPEGEA
ncbi:MAG TPA: cupin domain-containing protein [Rectinemataceae bacterium]|nr:cupin domain-containing protein [Rectinemataceae bacterium]